MFLVKHMAERQTNQHIIDNTVNTSVAVKEEVILRIFLFRLVKILVNKMNKSILSFFYYILCVFNDAVLYLKY